MREVGDDSDLDLDLFNSDDVIIIMPALASMRDLQPNLTPPPTLNSSSLTLSLTLENPRPLLALLSLGLVGGSKLTPERSLVGLAGVKGRE